LAMARFVCRRKLTRVWEGLVTGRAARPAGAVCGEGVVGALKRAEIPWFDGAHHRPLRFVPVGMTGLEALQAGRHARRERCVRSGV
jgi:hypothetical protein